MHYSTLVITAEKPTEADIDRILEPFNESLYYDKWWEIEEKYGEDEAYKRVETPVFMWDRYEIGGRYETRLETKIGNNNSACLIDDILNWDKVPTHICIDDTNGDVIVKKIWSGDKFVDNNDYDNKLAVIKERSKGKGYYATMVDIHD